MLGKKRIAVIGAGKLGETIIRALLDAKVVQSPQISGTTRHPETASRKTKQHGVRITTDNVKTAREADVIILAVKPQMMQEVLGTIKKSVTKDKLDITIARQALPVVAA